jgi:hypothetical protein
MFSNKIIKMDSDKTAHQKESTEWVPSTMEEDNEILLVTNNDSFSKEQNTEQMREEFEPAQKDKSGNNIDIEKQEKRLKTDNIVIELPQSFQQYNLSGLTIIQLYQYYNKLKQYYYSLNSQLTLNGENLLTLQKNNESFKIILNHLSMITLNIKTQLNNDLHNKNDKEHQTYLNQAIQQISNIILVNKEISKYKKKLKNFKDSPETINKIVLNENISKSKSGNQLLELQQEYNSFVQQYTKLIDKIEKNKLIITKNDEKIQQLNETIDSLSVIAEKNYNLILGPEDNKNSKEKEKLSNLRKSLINEYGDNYNNKNILKNIIQTKENEISKQKRMISDYNNQISNYKNEVTLIEDELRRMYNTINEIVKEEELT